LEKKVAMIFEKGENELRQLIQGLKCENKGIWRARGDCADEGEKRIKGSRHIE